MGANVIAARTARLKEGDWGRFTEKVDGVAKVLSPEAKF